jgi:hypothetical protein
MWIRIRNTAYEQCCANPKNPNTQASLKSRSELRKELEKNVKIATSTIFNLKLPCSGAISHVHRITCITGGMVHNFTNIF